MSKQLESIDSDLANWIAQQKIFFVATAPLSAEAHINISPKGGDSFRVLGPMEAVYQDYTGSGAETAAHVRENGRIIVMFCAFDGPPKIVRLHGRAKIISSNDPAFEKFSALFPGNPGTRAFVHIQVTRISSSCGYSVPFFDFRCERDALNKWATTQGPEKLRDYRAKKNQVSIDGLPALPSVDK
ncbi:MAG TPA: pyridoxamine 5'-phosphate oxidase family protein [Verrucomicrobiae bacterium]